MSVLGALLSLCFTGIACNQPLDYGMVGTTQQVEQPFLEGTSSWYDYKLGGKWWSKSHSTCALRNLPKYGHYKVCAGEKCITCYQNDRGPKREDRVIDLSSYAFKQLAPLSRGVVHVKIYKLDY